VAFLRTGYKGLPQRSVLSPIMYNFYTHLVEACLHPLCSILQYADDLVVNICEKHVEAVRNCLQKSLTRLMTWFGDLGLSLSANKSEMLLFLGNMKFLRFRCGSVILHFEISLNLNIWE
jgi:hypothetical protein